MIKVMRSHRSPLRVVQNPDVVFENLPTEAEVIDPATGRPKKGIRYRVAKRSIPTPACPDGVVHEIQKVDF